jgi:hypothetical protein
MIPWILTIVFWMMIAGAVGAFRRHDGGDNIAKHFSLSLAIGFLAANLIGLLLPLEWREFGRAKFGKTSFEAVKEVSRTSRPDVYRVRIKTVSPESFGRLAAVEVYSDDVVDWPDGEPLIRWERQETKEGWYWLLGVTIFRGGGERVIVQSRDDWARKSVEKEMARAPW